MLSRADFVSLAPVARKHRDLGECFSFTLLEFHYLRFIFICSKKCFNGGLQRGAFQRLEIAMEFVILWFTGVIVCLKTSILCTCSGDLRWMTGKKKAVSCLLRWWCWNGATSAEPDTAPYRFLQCNPNKNKTEKASWSKMYKLLTELLEMPETQRRRDGDTFDDVYPGEHRIFLCFTTICSSLFFFLETLRRYSLIPICN